MIEKILIVNAGPIYPIRAMNQMRTHNMIITLSTDFRVDLLTPYIDDESYNASHKALKDAGGDYIPIKSVKNKKKIIKKRLVQVLEIFNYLIFGIDKEVTANRWNNKEIIRLINRRGYKIVISNYWEASLYFKNLGDEVYKILDPHYAVGENLDVLSRVKKNKIRYFLEKRKLRRNLNFERAVIAVSDLLLPLSLRNQEEFLKIAPNKPMLIVPDGAELDHYLSYSLEPDPLTILFYGAMGSNQNIGAFWRLFNNILPELEKEFPEIKLLVVGSGPPDEIKNLHDGARVIVTGFVKDVRPWLSKAWLSIIPLELGSGFRGRVIELMAMGVPVVGTHNALDSIGMKNGEQGFIGDSDKELTKYCIELMQNSFLRNNISSNAKNFVRMNFSLEATFGKINKYLISLYLDGCN